jgi:putative transposase
MEPGSPRENGFAESLKCRFRDESLKTEVFTTAPEAQILADRWRWKDNTLRPHSSLQVHRPWRQLNRELQSMTMTTHSQSAQIIPL